MPSSQGSQPEKPRKTAGNGAGRGSAAQNGGRVFRNPPTGSAQDIHRTPPHSVEADQAIDLITFTQVLRDRNLLEGVGGAAFVTSLFTFVPTAANVQYYIDIVL